MASLLLVLMRVSKSPSSCGGRLCLSSSAVVLDLSSLKTALAVSYRWCVSGSEWLLECVCFRYSEMKQSRM